MVDAIKGRWVWFNPPWDNPIISKALEMIADAWRADNSTIAIGVVPQWINRGWFPVISREVAGV